MTNNKVLVTRQLLLIRKPPHHHCSETSKVLRQYEYCLFLARSLGPQGDNMLAQLHSSLPDPSQDNVKQRAALIHGAGCLTTTEQVNAIRDRRLLLLPVTHITHPAEATVEEHEPVECIPGPTFVQGIIHCVPGRRICKVQNYT
jgi:hypothetical protein